ncbi:Uncharacterized protein SCF082_LOCUS51432 [Durusdinium trenchii]|uniref:Uncharacterized protein n=1 Tax=Durusdinium trenchii TaxID=1381693 RepID=A0ABP0SEE0_9DINO
MQEASDCCSVPSHSCVSLAKGIGLVGGEMHEPAAMDIDAMIQASKDRIESAQRRLADLQREKTIELPETHPEGAPYVARADGGFVAGNAVTLRRYVTPKKDGTLKCSKDCFDLYQQPGGSAKLKALLTRHGQLGIVEASVKRWIERKARFDKKGGWYTKIWLATERHWTKPMIQTAWEWAEKRGKKRKNPVHGEEEICFVLDDEFLLREERGQSLSASGSFEMEDPDADLLDGVVVPEASVHANDAANFAADQMCGHEDGDKNEAARAGSSSFKLHFPSLKQNVSQLSLLPTFVDVCSKKLDNSDKVLEQLQDVGTAKAIELIGQMKTVLAELKKTHQRMIEIQADSLVNVDRDFEKELQPLLTTCTKLDVTLNNYVVRARLQPYFMSA